MLEKVISGGQTGLDHIGLEVARDTGIPTGGTAAKGWMTENGPDPTLGSLYGLVECETPGYPARTWKNVTDSDATVWYGDDDTSGYYRTRTDCKKAGKELIVNPSSQQLVDIIIDRKIRVLNVAGNRGSKLSQHKAELYRRILEMTFERFAKPQN